MKEAEVKKLVGEENWDIFTTWMSGQTIGIVDGEFDYYEWDVKRFVEGTKK